MNEMIPFGQWMRQRRKALDLTQEALAQKIECSLATIQKIETGSRHPSRRNAELLADALAIPDAERPRFLEAARMGWWQPDLLKTRNVPETSPPNNPSETSPPNNLPTPPNALIGRKREMKAILDLLQSAEVRLATLTGPGGIGKTRLALEVARAVLGRFADGVYFVSLAPVSSPDFLVSTIANALQFSFQGTMDPKVQLLAHLSNKQMLLVLDNFEHLLDGRELVVDLIHQAPGIRLLITSRERLNIAGEWVNEVAGLKFPRTVKRLQDDNAYGAAVQLFLERSRQVSSKEEPSEQERLSVVRICQMVEGMPLAIELAAAWRLVLSYEEIAQEIEKSLASSDKLEESLAFLATSSKSTLPRHRSMIAVFEPSWDLLSAGEQRMCRQLSVFRGGFRREAAERVVGATLRHLAALVDKSFLRYNGAGYYDMHELVRQFVAMKLAQLPDERDATCDLHSSYYARMLHQRKGHLRSHLSGGALKEIRAEIENIRQAWQWIVTHGKVTEMQQSLQSLLDFYDTQGWFQMGEEAFRQAAEALKRLDQSSGEESTLHTIVLGQVLAGQGWLYLASGRYEQAVETSQASLHLLGQYEAHEGMIHPLITLGMTAQAMGDYTGSQQYLQASLALQRAVGDRWSEGWSTGNLGVVAYMCGEYQKAHDLFAEAQVLLQELGDKRMIELSYSFLSMATCALRDYAEAERLAQEGLALSREIGHQWGIALALCNLGVDNYYLGRTADAAQQLLSSVKLFKKVEEPWGIALALNYLANGWYIAGAHDQAKSYACEALAIAAEARLAPLALEALVTLAAVHIQSGEKGAAHLLLRLALEHSGSTHFTRERAQNLLTALEADLTPELIPGRSQDALQFDEIVEKELKACL